MWNRKVLSEKFCQKTEMWHRWNFTLVNVKTCKREFLLMHENKLAMVNSLQLLTPPCDSYFDVLTCHNFGVGLFCFWINGLSLRIIIHQRVGAFQFWINLDWPRIKTLRFEPWLKPLLEQPDASHISYVFLFFNV